VPEAKDWWQHTTMARRKGSKDGKKQERAKKPEADKKKSAEAKSRKKASDARRVVTMSSNYFGV
jgi:hypothetical protein